MENNKGDDLVRWSYELRFTVTYHDEPREAIRIEPLTIIRSRAAPPSGEDLDKAVNNAWRDLSRRLEWDFEDGSAAVTIDGCEVSGPVMSELTDADQAMLERISSKRTVNGPNRERQRT